jgi:hypothetical protein
VVASGHQTDCAEASRQHNVCPQSVGGVGLSSHGTGVCDPLCAHNKGLANTVLALAPLQRPPYAGYRCRFFVQASLCTNGTRGCSSPRKSNVETVEITVSPSHYVPYLNIGAVVPPHGVNPGQEFRLRGLDCLPEDYSRHAARPFTVLRMTRCGMSNWRWELRPEGGGEPLALGAEAGAGHASHYLITIYGCITLDFTPLGGQSWAR